MVQDTNLLIDQLAADLQPVSRLWHPALRAVCWLVLVAMIGVLMGFWADLPAIEYRLAAFPDMWLAVCGSVLTAILAAIACFQISLPDRDRIWALLPLPGLLIWIGASGMGCLRGAVIPGIQSATLGLAADDCVPFILGVSLPLSLTLMLMLRRALPLRAGLVSALGGLAAAASSASLLWIVHPFDATAADLAMHALAVVIVVLAARALGPRTFR